MHPRSPALRATLAAVSLALPLALPLAGSATLEPTFSAPVLVDPAAPTGEPSVKLDAAGNVFITAPAGFPTPSYVWRSTDGGRTFHRVDQVTLPLLGLPIGVRNAAPGGSDSDVAVDARGIVYVADLWPGSATVEQSTDQGKTFLVAQPLGGVAMEDRPWLAVWTPPALLGAAAVPTRVTVVANQEPVGIFATTSVDGGLTFPITSLIATFLQRGDLAGRPPDLGCNCPPGVPAVAPDGTMYEPLSSAKGLSVLRSDDGGATWQQHMAVPGVNWSGTDNVFPVASADAAGRIYVLYSDGQRVSATASGDRGATWSAPVTISGPGKSLMPWAAAHRAGGADAAWYTQDPQGRWHVGFAQTTDGGASWSEPATLPDTVHQGPLFRALLDFLTVTTDAEGWAHIAYAEDATSPWTPHVMYASQTSGTVV